jgi:hypothetical protein
MDFVIVLCLKLSKTRRNRKGDFKVVKICNCESQAKRHNYPKIIWPLLHP